MTRRDTPLAWAQGIRPADTLRSVPPMRWQEVVWRRLTGRLHDLIPGRTTADSEGGIGIEPHVYYYVGTSHAEFGDAVIVLVDHSNDSVDITQISPFDTGGVATDNIPFTHPLDDGERAALVARETYSVGDYQQPFEEWLTRAFASTASYVEGENPTESFVPEVIVTPPTEERAWRWEGRIRARDLPGPPLTPIALFLKDGDKVEYENWVMRDAPLTPADRLVHLRMFRSIAREVGNPVRAAKREIVKGAP